MDKKYIFVGIIAVIGLVAAAPFLLPKQEVQLDQKAPPTDAMEGDAMPGDSMEGDSMESDTMSQPEIQDHRMATWRDGDSAHKASGTLTIVTVDGAPYLHFEDFELTAGPDVYLYLTMSDAPESTVDVEVNGVRIDVSTDADSDARLNERGTFFVPLEMSLEELDQYAGVAAWCDDFNVLFGSGALQDSANAG